MAFEVRHLPGDVIGLDAFGRDVLAQRPRPAAFGWSAGAAGITVPARTAECPEHAGALDESIVDREELALALRAAHPLAALHPAVERALVRFEDPRATCVVAPVAVGFLGGPLATLVAALHAIALARELERTWARPVVPLVWLASDEHDRADAHSVWLVNRHLDLTKSGLASFGRGARPIGSITLDEHEHHLGAAAAHLAQILPEGPRSAAALALCVPRADETLAEAQRRVLFALLGQHGLLVVEPRHVREPLGRALARLVAQADAQLLPPETAGAPLVFRHVEGRRHALHLANDGVASNFLHAGEEAQRSGLELAALIAAAPQDFSAAPLVEALARELVLPVAATVGDWNVAHEFAAGALWRRCAHVPLGVFVPRAQVTLLSQDARAALDKRSVDVELVLRTRGALPPPPTAERPAVLDRLKALLQRQALELKELRADLALVEKGLAHHLKRAADENADRVAKILERAERVHANRTGTGRRHDRRITNSLTPRGEPQADVLSTAQYAAVFGTDWIDALLEALDPWPSEHLVFAVD
jgi:uncharacterized protein YllA (UPF0747 family)